MCVDEPSVFKASDNRMREEVRGAEEVPEDANTAVELPVDQVFFSFFLSSPILSFHLLMYNKNVCNCRDHQTLLRMRSFLKEIHFKQPI